MGIDPTGHAITRISNRALILSQDLYKEKDRLFSCSLEGEILDVFFWKGTGTL
jgi:hypothetical protein